MFCINTQLIVNQLTLNQCCMYNLLYMNFSVHKCKTIIIKRCTTKFFFFRNKFYRFVEGVAHYRKSIQRLLMQIR